jgi:outer membrane receptor protein involved in Fe transport
VTALSGQTVRGTIVGIVRDVSGAVISNASVTLLNQGTNVSSSALTTAQGEYTFTNVDPGTYRVTARVAGFKLAAVENIELFVNQTIREDFALELGDVNTEVSVEAHATAVQTDSSEVGSVVDSREVAAIPLNGRAGIAGLLALAPGVQQPGGGFGNGATGTGAGQYPIVAGSSRFGGNNMTVDGIVNNDMLNERILITIPSLDAVAEFKVIANAASAEFGRGGAQILVATKSGTNEIHGSLLYYNRNRVTAAKNFFATGLPKPPFNRNEFGGTLGGPIRRNKLFFFGGYEGLRLRQSITNVLAMPTDALKAGNFAGLAALKDPLNGAAPFPNNVIPAGRISPVAQRLDQYTSTPNGPGTAAGGLGNNFTYNSPQQEFNDRYSMRIDYNLNDRNKLSGRYFQVDNGPFVLPVGTGSEKFGNWSGFGIGTRNAGGSYLHLFGGHAINEFKFGMNRERDFRVPQNNNLDASALIPGLSPDPAGLGGLPTITITGFRGFSEAGGSNDIKHNYQASDTFTWNAGAHSWKFGLEYQRAEAYNIATNRGSFTVDGRYTGNAFGDFLMGYISASSRANKANERTITNGRYAAFAQDDWKVSSRLTVNLGVRYEYLGLFGLDKPAVNFYPGIGLVVLQGTPDPLLAAGLPIVNGQQAGLALDNYRDKNFADFGPRLGFAYRPFSRSPFVVRASYGIFYIPVAAGSSAGRLTNNPPFIARASFEPAPGTVPSLTLDNAFPGQGTLPANPTLSTEARHRPDGYVQEWNMTFEGAVRNLGLRATYLGSKGTHLQQDLNRNDPPPAPGQVQPLRPYQPFGTITETGSEANGVTHQAQLGATRRFSNGLSFQFEYQFTRALGSPYTASAPLDNRNRRLDRGNLDNVRRHYAVAGYIYDLPFGPGKPLGAGLTGVAAKLIGGWQLAGEVLLSTGQPFSVTYTSTTLGQPSGRADIIGDPNAGGRSLTQWFNPAAFAAPVPYLFGNSAPNSLWGPGFNNWDSAVFKNTTLHERVSLQFRSELFNVLNHPNFDVPAANISAKTTVGRISSASDPRTIQFSLRLLF